jgi:hypothetical protein
MTSPSDVSLVFQGPVLTPDTNAKSGHLTYDCIAAARQVMPAAEIILSTWEGAPVEGIPADKIILNKDPGNWQRSDGSWTNVNRQIISTRNGLAQASRRFAVKIRTDTLITGTGFLTLPRSTSKRLPKWTIFKERILILETITRNPARFPGLHHPSDFFQFGLTEDLAYFWDSPLATPDIHQAWHLHYPRPLLSPFINSKHYHKCTDEQYLWLQCLRKQHPEVDLDYLWQAEPRQIAISESLLTANFMIASCAAAGVRLPDRFLTEGWPEKCYRSSEWLHLNALYQCDQPSWRRQFRVWQVRLGTWKALARATMQRPLIRLWESFRFHILARLRKPS